jgi:hypothetical protein
MKPSRWAIRLTNGREDRGLLVVRHGVAAVYADEANAQREAKWLCGIAKRNGSGTVYSPTPWKDEMGMELQDRWDGRSGGSKRTLPDPTSRGGGNSKSDIPESSEGNLTGLLCGSSDTDGTA